MIKQVIEHPPAKHDPIDVPRPPRNFINREELLEQLSQLVDDDPGATILVNGWREIGKTAFVHKWVSDNKERFPHARIYVDMAKYSHYDDPMFEVLHSLVRRLGATPEQITGNKQHLHSVYLSVTQSLTGVIIVDDVRNDEDARYLTPGSDTCVLIATSTTQLLGTEFDSLTVQALQPDNGRKILGRFCGSERIAAEPIAVDMLLDICGGVPSVLRVVASRLRDRPHVSVESFVEEFLGEDDPALNVFQGQYEEFDAATKKLYRRLAAAPGQEFDEYLAAAMAELDIATARRCLETLRNAFLVDEVGDRIYRYSAVVGRHITYCAKRDDAPSDLQKSALMAAERYQYLLEQADITATGSKQRIDHVVRNDTNPAFADEAEALLWVHENLENLRTIFNHAIEEGRHEVVWKLAEHMWAYFADVKGQSQALDTYMAAVESAKEVNNAAATSRMLALQAKSHNDLGQYDDAIRAAEEAHHIAITVQGDIGPRLEATALEFIGRAYQKAEDYPQALTFFRQSLDIGVANGLIRHQSLIHRFIGEIYRETHQAHEALAQFDKAKVLLETLPEVKHRDLSIISLQMAETYVQVQELDRARQESLAAIDFALEAGRPVREARGWQLMTQIASSPVDQVHYLGKAIEALQPINDPQIASLTAQIGQLKSQVE